MNSKLEKKKVVKGMSILVIGALLTGGGLFLWQNQFKLALFSNASSDTIQAVISLGETNEVGIPSQATAVKTYLETKQAKPIELTSRAERGLAVSNLRDQTVLAYNDLTKPITNHVVFLVFVGKNDLLLGIKDKDSISTISKKITKNISEFIQLSSNRPGIFPEGFTVYLATLPDPLNGTGNAELCNGDIPNYGKEYTRGVIKEINTSIRAMKTIYPENIKIVDLEKTFSNHGLGGTDSWFSTCLMLNSDGTAALEGAYLQAVQDTK